MICTDTPVLDYALGEGMKLEGHEETYRVAFEAANSDLKQISASLEQLRIRKDHLEKLVAVLGPMVDREEKAAKSASGSEATTEQEVVAQAVQSKPEEAGDRLVADPFQRRIDHVLGIGAGIRDVRKYTRQF
jgi:hypothetical protein